jgi:hypothetical protein
MYMYILRMFDNVKTHADRYCTFPPHMGSRRSDHQLLLWNRDLSTLPSPSFPCPSAVRAAIRLICTTLSIHCSMPSFGVCSSTSPARENMMQLLYQPSDRHAAHPSSVEQCHLSQASSLPVFSCRNMGCLHRYHARSLPMKFPPSSPSACN